MTNNTKDSKIFDQAAWDTWDAEGGARTSGPQALNHATTPVSAREPATIGLETELFDHALSVTNAQRNHQSRMGVPNSR